MTYLCAQFPLVRSSFKGSEEMIKFYSAGKLSSAQYWIDMEASHADFILTARWPRLVGRGVEDSPENAKEFWVHDLEDVAEADILMVLAPGLSDGVLRGALVEVGAALALGIPVILIGGGDPNLGTWQYHPDITTVTNGFSAFAKARQLLKGKVSHPAL